ncbi:MAG: ribokinase [Bacilli bacterium]|nr:ribokinase [Bacilli bacterium]
MMKKPKIVIIGLCGQSIFLKVDHFHKQEETLKAQSIHEEVGGKGFNQAVTIKRLGGEPFFVGAIGDDIYGKLCDDFLYDEKINYQLLRKPFKTALATIIRNKKGENQVTVYPGASSQIDIDDLEELKHSIESCDIVLLQLETPLDIVFEIINFAFEKKKRIILNPAPAILYNKETFDKTWLLTPNFQEVKKLFNLDDKINISQLIEILPTLGRDKMIVTLGEKGILLLENKKVLHLPSYNLKTVDTTGAGDVFNGALAVKIGEGSSLFDASLFAIVAAGISVSRDYVMPSIPSRDEVEKHLQEYKSYLLVKNNK